MKPLTTWILVADRAGARLLRNAGPGCGLQQLTAAANAGGADTLARVAGRLDRVSARPGFDRLIIVAPPPTLGELRRALSPAVRAHIYGELGRDLTGCSNAAVGSLVADAFVCFAP